MAKALVRDPDAAVREFAAMPPEEIEVLLEPEESYGSAFSVLLRRRSPGRPHAHP